MQAWKSLGGRLDRFVIILTPWGAANDFFILLLPWIIFDNKFVNNKQSKYFSQYLGLKHNPKTNATDKFLQFLHETNQTSPQLFLANLLMDHSEFYIN